MDKKNKKIVLFICKHNRFRSKVAEVLFDKYDKNKKWKAESAGIKLDLKRRYVASNVKRVLRRFGINRVNNKSIKITKKMAQKADLIVDVANDVRIPKKLIKNKNVVNWNISDTSQENYLGILWRVHMIKRKVKSLIKSLKTSIT